MSSLTSVVAADGTPDSTPHGGGHRRLAQLRRWPLPELPTAPPRGPAIDIRLNLGYVASFFLVTPTRGHRGKYFWVIAVPKTRET
jgi:hypothetical protein